MLTLTLSGGRIGIYDSLNLTRVNRLLREAGQAFISRPCMGHDAYFGLKAQSTTLFRLFLQYGEIFVVYTNLGDYKLNQFGVLLKQVPRHTYHIDRRKTVGSGRDYDR
jgi:hypothetical protein